MQTITPFLWFEANAEEAAQFYVSIFEDSKVLNVTRYGAGAAGPEGAAMSVTFRLRGQTVIALNGGPHYRLSPAFSLFVRCETQREVDALWERLSEGGTPLQCGWLTDRFGLTWQIIPTLLGTLMSDPDPAKAQRVRDAMLKMVKIDSALLQQAYDEA